MRTPVKTMLCSKLAIATALVVGATPAAAQSFQGNVTSSTGVAAPVHGAGTTTIDVTSSQAVINWSATGASSGGNTTFQASGTTATFQGASKFAVLNRVSPTVSTDAIYMNGTINSLVNGQVGGTVYFYSPNGIVIGQNASINVGSLGLTTLPINDSEGMWINFPDESPQVVFNLATNALSYIRTDQGAQLNANGFSNYVALVAPHVAHRGTIRTDGAAALVGAAGATITFRPNNLFDIMVTTGSSDDTGVIVDGGRIERNSDSIGGNHRAYLVALPTNNAMTMLVQGGADLGFDIAGSAGVEGNAVVLSAGGDVYDGVAAPGSTQADVAIDGVTVTSDLFVNAGGSISLTSGSGAGLYMGDVTLTAPTMIQVDANDYDITINGHLTATTDRIGDEGQSVEAGDITIRASDAGATLQIASAELSAVGTGGWVSEGLIAGDGKGGDILVQGANGGSVEISGDLDAMADGEGGYVFSFGGVGGDGTGGSVMVLANGGSSNVSVEGTAYLQAYGRGGETGGDCSACEVSGGDGRGGRIDVNGATGSGNTLDFGELWMFASGTGGNGDGIGGGGDGYGGQSYLSAADGAVVTSMGVVYNFADGGGGDGFNSGSGGNGFGGIASINGFGAAGGQINLQNLGANYVTAEAIGGSGGSSGGNGGNATGGTASVTTNGMTLDVNGTLYVRSDVRGGNAVAGTGGSAVGGQAIVNAAATDLTVDKNLLLHAYAEGGQGLSGGNGAGGTAELVLQGGDAIIGGTTTVDARGKGGAATGQGGNGGTGTGGIARLYGSSGTGTLTGAVLIDAAGTGGASASGAGGNGDGGRARLNADGATFNALNNLTLRAISTGGNGATGGNAIARPATAAVPTDALILADNNGVVTVNGITLADASAYGGNGSNGGGGHATAGSAGVFLEWGSATLGNLNVAADGYGGDGGNGGLGGDGRGGRSRVEAWGTKTALLAASDIDVSARGTGGDGGAGTNGLSGGNGGNGGTGTGGTIAFWGSAANGTLVASGTSDALAGGFGGDGGAGGNGVTGAGGNGGIGGIGGAGAGGSVQLGSVSNPAAPGSSGGTTYSVLNADSSATGGSGGNGGSGGSSTAIGGAGGAATGGAVNYLARGVLVTANAVNLSANATGGDGGLGSVQGNGGNAATGRFAVEAVNRFDHSAQRGRLVANSIVALADAAGGDGQQDGVGSTAGTSYFRVLDGDATIGSVNLLISADAVGADGFEDYVSIINGAATIAGSFQFQTADEMSALANNGTLSANTLTLTASNFVHDSVNAPPANIGTFAAAAIAVTSGNDIILDAHLVADSAINLNATGLIAVHNLTAGGDTLPSDITLEAGNSITAGTIVADGAVDLFAGDDITTGTIVGVSADLFAEGNITVGNSTVAEWFDAETYGALTAGDVTAGDYIALTADLALVAGNLSAGIVNQSTAFDADHSIGVVSGTSVQLGNVNAFGWVGIASLGSLATGSIASGDDVLLAADGNINVGPITFGNGNRLLISGFDMIEYGIGESDEDDFDRSLVFAAVNEGGAVPTGGSVTIGGPINGGTADIFAGHNYNGGAMSLIDRARIEAGGSLVSGNITANGRVALAAGGNLTTGNVTSSLESIDVTVIGNASLGALTAYENIDVFADGTLMALNLVSGTVNTQAAGNVTLGNVTAGTINIGSMAGSVGTGNLNATQFGINIVAAGNIATGNASGAQYYFASAGGDIMTGNLSVGGEIDFEAGDDISTGTIAAELVDFTADGDAAIGIANVSQSLYIEAAGSLTAGNITAGDTILLYAGGALVANNLSAGVVDPADDADAEYLVAAVSLTSVALGSVEAGQWVGIGSAGTVNAGSIEAGNDVLILADGNVQTGAITSGGESRTLIAGFEMVEVGGGESEDFDRSLVFGAVDDGDATATNGSVTIGGAIETGRLDIFAGNNVTVGDLDLGAEGRIDAGALLTLNGDIDNFVTLISGDIHVAEGAIIDDAQLVSRNAQGTFIGDGLAGTNGYRLSNAEFNRFEQLGIAADISRGAGTTMTIGDLTVANDGSDYWSFEFADGDFEDGDQLQGTIRIVGDVRFTGMGDVGSDEDGGWVEFISRQFQIDAATGSLSLEGAQGVLGGGIAIEAQHVAVAEGAILDRLADDPTYAELAADLAQPTETSVPGGVIRAGIIEIELGEPGEGGGNTNGAPTYSVYVQNSGTAEVPAGFTAREASVEISEGAPTAPIAMIVNGQFVTGDATLTGVAVRDEQMADDDPSRFTATSTINGCLLSGACVIDPVLPPEPVPDPVPDIASQIILISAPAGDDQEFGNEEAIEDNEEDGGEQGAASPIQPPLPLFNTKPLETTGETDEPVSGGGNPALIGNGAGPADDDDDDDDDEEEEDK